MWNQPNRVAFSVASGCVVTGEDAGPRTQISPVVSGRLFAPCTSRMAMSMPVRGKPQVPTCISVVHAVQRGGSTVMLPVTSPSPKYCTRPVRASQRVFLVGAIHRRAGIDDVAQQRVVALIHRLVPRQHRQDGRHGEQVGDAVLLHELPRRLDVQTFAGSSTLAAPRATCGSAWMPAPCDSGATTSDTSCSVVAGIRSHRWLQMTYSIWPCVSMPAFGRPVVPDV